MAVLWQMVALMSLGRRLGQNKGRAGKMADRRDAFAGGKGGEEGRKEGLAVGCPLWSLAPSGLGVDWGVAELRGIWSRLHRR
jgi:hypothetical protein